MNNDDKLQATVCYLYTGWAIYKSDKLVHTETTGHPGWPVALLRSVGFKVDVLECGDQQFWREQYGYVPPSSLLELKTRFSAFSRTSGLSRLAAAEKEVEKLRKELAAFGSVGN